MEILVVDDDPMVLESCRRVLEAEGYAVATAAGVAEAKQAFEAGRFHLLLVDIKMPGDDGFALVCWMREHVPGVPCLVMSGYATLDTISESRGCGACGFLPKPFTPDELVCAVREAFDRK